MLHAVLVEVGDAALDFADAVLPGGGGDGGVGDGEGLSASEVGGDVVNLVQVSLDGGEGEVGSLHELVLEGEGRRSCQLFHDALLLQLPNQLANCHELLRVGVMGDGGVSAVENVARQHKLSIINRHPPAPGP